ncbi:unnamed protein product [Albugo candida]|uniref:Uncharacterized protein n=1 Tax=Albugo candida TaxID=65357 RepID=A0A024G5A5_9STRA|nr:unnamed protein product [Albugo candida]|eukprot:CCI41916.1 unnamed protein product [Albugo candida]
MLLVGLLFIRLRNSFSEEAFIKCKRASYYKGYGMPSIPRADLFRNRTNMRSTITNGYPQTHATLLATQPLHWYLERDAIAYDAVIIDRRRQHPETPFRVEILMEVRNAHVYAKDAIHHIHVTYNVRRLTKTLSYRSNNQKIGQSSK